VTPAQPGIGPDSRSTRVSAMRYVVAGTRLKRVPAIHQSPAHAGLFCCLVPSAARTFAQPLATEPSLGASARPCLVPKRPVSAAIPTGGRHLHPLGPSELLVRTAPLVLRSSAVGHRETTFDERSVDLQQLALRTFPAGRGCSSCQCPRPAPRARSTDADRRARPPARRPQGATLREWRHFLGGGYTTLAMVADSQPSTHPKNT
jgi:hypothetical protein